MKFEPLKDGRFIAVWLETIQGDSAVRAQFFNADGSRHLAERTLARNDASSTVKSPDVDVGKDGRILVGWSRETVSGYGPNLTTERNIEARFIDADGKMGPNLITEGLNSRAQVVPEVEVLSDGRYAIGCYEADSDRHQVSVFEANGAFVDFNTAPNSPLQPRSSPQGDVAWVGGARNAWVHVTTVQGNHGMDPNSLNVVATLKRDFDPANPSSPMTLTVMVTNALRGDQYQSTVTGLDNGNFVVAWTHNDGNPANYGDGSESSVKFRMFNNNGIALTQELIVNTTTAHEQFAPVIASRPGGGFVVAFMDVEQGYEGIRKQDIRVACFDANGNREGEDFLVAVENAGRQASPAITVLSNGRIVVGWIDETGIQGGGAFGLRAQIFDTGAVIPDTGTGTNPDPNPRQPQPPMGTAGDDLFDGTLYEGKFDGAAGRDTVSYEASADGVTVFFDSPENGISHGKNDSFESIEVFIGSRFADELYGGSPDEELRGQDGNDLILGKGGKDLLMGGAGDDTLDGGMEADMLDGGDGNDTVSYAELNSAEGVTVSLTTPSNNNGQARGDTYTSIENLTGTNSTDTLTGDDGSNRITGLGGNDRLIGGDGDDYLEGGDGDDTLDGGAGADTLDGGSGNNTYIADDADTQIRPTGSGIQTIQAKVNFTLAADARIDILRAGEEAGSLRLIGNDLNNTIMGNARANVIKGQGGDDKLFGGAGRDVLDGGRGKDVFAFDARVSKGNVDRISDFKVKDDSIWLDNAVFTKLGKKGSESAPAKINHSLFTTGEAAKDANDYLIYNRNTGKLFYDADGSGDRYKATEIAQLNKGLKLTHHDFFVI